jgi:hypothetical protein
MYNTGSGVLKNHREAFKWFHEAAQKEHGAAQASLGAMYFDGIGIPKDEKMAMELYQKAADNGFAPAQSYLGSAYEAKNEITEAIFWYRKAAQQGEPFAQTNLGLIYGLGQSIHKNELIAYGLLEMAVLNGSETALDIRDTIAKSLTLSKRDEAKALAREPEKLWALMDAEHTQELKN